MGLAGAGGEPLVSHGLARIILLAGGNAGPPLLSLVNGSGLGTTPAVTSATGSLASCHQWSAVSGKEKGKEGARGVRAWSNGDSSRGGRSTSKIYEMNRGSGGMALSNSLYIPPGNPSDGLGKPTRVPFPLRGFPLCKVWVGRSGHYHHHVTVKAEPASHPQVFTAMMTGRNEASGSDASVPVATKPQLKTAKPRR